MLQQKNISILMGLILILGTGSLVFMTKKPRYIPSAESETLATPSTTPVQKKIVVTPPVSLSQIASHNTRQSCWSAINGFVYDLTSFIPNHPGGDHNILRLCGIDGSAAYNAKHGGESKPARILGGFKIGLLAN